VRRETGRSDGDGDSWRQALEKLSARTSLQETARIRRHVRRRSHVELTHDRHTRTLSIPVSSSSSAPPLPLDGGALSTNHGARLTRTRAHPSRRIRTTRHAERDSDRYALTATTDRFDPYPIDGWLSVLRRRPIYVLFSPDRQYVVAARVTACFSDGR
jgi:hypothetical protein